MVVDGDRNDGGEDSRDLPRRDDRAVARRAGAVTHNLQAEALALAAFAVIVAIVMFSSPPPSRRRRW
jgi:hypothetical protein